MVRRACAVVVALLVGVAAPAAAAGPSPSGDVTAGYDFTFRSGLTPLKDSTRWVLQGQKLAGGACRYNYDFGESEIPAAGWELRSIAADVSRCAKLIEQGTPVRFDPITMDEGTTVTQLLDGDAAGPGSQVAIATASSKAAWQKVTWYDPLPFGGLWVNFDVTQINWSYNGSSVSAGSTSQYVGWRWGSGWGVSYSNMFGSYGSGNSFYLGETNAGFDNQAFCWPLPTTYTYYYWNRVWGQPNGTATINQSSDTVDECVGPFHFDIQTAYGTWQP